MDFSLTAEQQAICDEVRRLCAPFDDDYWLERDRTGEFPGDFHAALPGTEHSSGLSVGGAILLVRIGFR